MRTADKVANARVGGGTLIDQHAKPVPLAAVPLIAASAIIAAMSDVRPGRFYSVDELAAVLRVQDKTALHRQLRTMAGDPDIHAAFKLRQASSDDFYRRVSFVPNFTLGVQSETNVS